MSAVQVWDRAWQMVETRKPAADMLFCLRSANDGHLLPSILPQPQASAVVGRVLRHQRASRARRIQGLQALHAGPGASADAHADAGIATTSSATSTTPSSSTIWAKIVGLSAFHTQRLFRRYLGISPRQYQQARRMEHFRTNLLTNDSVTTAMYEAGFASSSRLYETANEHLGMTPTEYRRGGKDVAIRYTIADSPLGKMLVAATGNGLCAVSFGSLESELEDRSGVTLPRI